jgi:hypothetical protein
MPDPPPVIRAIFPVFYVNKHGISKQNEAGPTLDTEEVVHAQVVVCTAVRVGLQQRRLIEIFSLSLDAMLGNRVERGRTEWTGAFILFVPAFDRFALPDPESHTVTKSDAWGPGGLNRSDKNEYNVHYIEQTHKS